MDIKSASRFRPNRLPTQAKAAKPEVTTEDQSAEVRDGVKWTSSVPENEMEHHKATPVQKLLAWGGAAATVAVGAGLVAGGAFATPLAAALTTGALVTGYLASDLGTGLVHHFLDNVDADRMEARGGTAANFVARIARDFQNHHHHTRDMVHRDFAHHTYDTAKFSTTVLAGLAGLAWTATAAAPAIIGPMIAGTAMVANMAVVAQEAHKRCHMSEKENPLWARALQKTGLFVNKEIHNKHHTEGHKSHYSLLNGLTNVVLDKTKFRLTPGGPKTNLLRKLEVGLSKWQGADANAWRENPGLKEEALGLN